MSTQKNAIKRLQNKEADQNSYRDYQVSTRKHIDQLFKILKDELSKKSKRKFA